MPAPPRSPKDWESAYEDVRPLYAAFLDKLKALTDDLLDERELSYDFTYTTLLNPAAFYSAILRARRDGIGLDDPLAELRGVANLTVIAADKADLAPLEDFLLREFLVDHGRWDGPEDAGRYDFHRYGISLDERRSSLPEWRPYDGLIVDMRFLSTLQDAWGDLDGELPYYGERSYPPSVRNQRIELVELLEFADEQFTAMREDLLRAEEEYASAIGAGDLSAELDGQSLQAYLEVASTTASLVQIAVEAGFQSDSEMRAHPKYVEGTLWLVRDSGFDTVAELDAFLTSGLDRAPELLADLADAAGYMPWAMAYSLVDWLVLVLTRCDAETVSLLDYNDDIEYALNTLIGNPVAPRD